MNTVTSETVSIEVAYALPEKQQILCVDVVEGSTAYDAVQQSGITQTFAEIDLEAVSMGVFGKTVKAKDYVVKTGDRVEIYRPLIADPKAVRKARAAKKA